MMDITQLITYFTIGNSHDSNIILLFIVQYLLKLLEKIKKPDFINYKNLIKLIPFRKIPFTRIIRYETITSNNQNQIPYDLQNSNNIIIQKSIFMNLKENYIQNYEECDIRLITSKDHGYVSKYNDYVISELPPNGIWIKINKDIELMNKISLVKEDSKERCINKISTLVILRSYHANGSELINKFVNDSYNFYVEKINKQYNDDKTYMYCIQNYYEDDTKDNNKLKNKKKYKRYLLSNEKTFETLFIKNKESILHILEHFVNKTGKYKIKGFPHKLGILLHGPPGTGKTSLIKAIASYTKRNIINLSLSKIKTNQELMENMFDGIYDVEGIDLPVKLGFEKTIFVIEDIDCISDIVIDRKDDKDECKNIYPHNFKEELEEIMVKKPIKDKLNLSGLLNAIDGIIDSPGRIIIMTTNHPEKLDEALIRPGRIDKNMYMGYIEYPEAISMIKHYFNCSDNKLIEFKKYFNDNKITPAQLEQKCMEYDSIKELLLNM